MAWRVHLSDDAIFRLDILHGSPDVLCAWVSSDEATFFDMASGASLGTFFVPRPLGIVRGTDDWADYLEALCAPNGARLPYVRTPELAIHQTDDGQTRLYEDGHGLFVADGTRTNGQEQEYALGTAEKSIVAVQMARETGNIAALDERGKLYLYEQQYLINEHELGLMPQENLLPDVVIDHIGDSVFASDGKHLLRTTADGTARQWLFRYMPYPIGKIACSPSGVYYATTDPETGIIRVYSGARLDFTHQKFAVDLFASAKQVQLIADVPTQRLGVSALAITDDGTLAFALEGIVTVAHIQAMEKMPSVF